MRKAARIIIAGIAIAVFLYSGFMLLRHYLQMETSESYAEEIAELAVSYITEPTQPSSTQAEQIATASETATEFMEVAPIHVDFDVLYAQNQDVVAWLYSPNTPIHSPVAQASNNEYYLHRLLDGSYNACGTLFMDYRNDSALTDWNTVIYGHNMQNDSMFGTLPNYKDQSYFEEHSEIYLITAQKSYKIHLFAGFVTSADAELYHNFHPGAEEAADLIDAWLTASDFQTQTRPTEQDHLITLSTCSYEYDNARYVLIGYLEEIAKG